MATVTEKSQRTMRPRIVLSLRTQHTNYLEYIAQRDEIPISHVVARIVTENASVLDPGVKPSRQDDRHITIEQEKLAILDGLVVVLGMGRSEIMRRLIDKAMSEDPILRLAV